MRRRAGIATIVLALICVGKTANASSILYQTAQGGYTTNVLYGPVWDNFTATMTASHSLTATADFSNLAQLLLYDAVWVDQELGNTLSAGEVTALTSYISSGHRVVLIGENNSWTAWNNSLMSVVGGTVTQQCSSAIGTPNVANSLTAGVGSVQNFCGSTANAAVNATRLFNNNLAALYTVGGGEALVILDSNWNDDGNGLSQDNEVFAQNVVNWLGPRQAAVPEPTTLILFGSGAAGLLARARRRKAR